MAEHSNSEVLGKRQRRRWPRSRRRASAALLWLAASATYGCGFLFHKPRVEQEPAALVGPWRLRCQWVEHGPRGPQDAPGPSDWGEVWATTPQGRDIEFTGRIEDGFYVLDGVRLGTAPVSEVELRWWQRIPGLRPKPPAPLPPEEPPAAAEDALAAACRETLARLRPKSPSDLVLVAAARSGEEIDVPIVFPRADSDAADPPGSGAIRRLVVFGDSLSDPGNLKTRLKVFPATPYWLGRFSNGPVWPQYLGAAAGLAVQNHSFGGAVTVPHDDVPTSSVIAAIEQGAQHFLTGSVDRYVADYVERDLTWGTLQSPNDTLFVVWSGGNDYLVKEGVSGEIGSLLDSPAGESGYFRIVEETT